MERDKINILVTFDKNYIGPFKTMLKSLVINNPGESFVIWLIHSSVSEEDLNGLIEYCSLNGAGFNPVKVERSLFENAPVSKQYPQEMYYRLLAPVILPHGLKKALYIDPDLLVVNKVRPVWDIELDGRVFAAASHTGIFDMAKGINKVRLGTEHDYFNTGVMIIDLEKAREIVKADDVFGCVREHSSELILPDQDVFNYLYGQYTFKIDDDIWNYDSRYYSLYLIRSNGRHNMDWIMQNTVFLHFCGKRKPWNSSHSGRFTALYKHYMNLAQKLK